MLLDLRRLIVRIGPWPRRAVAVLCLALAALTALDTSGRSTTTGTTPVAVATHGLAVGHVLARGDLTVRAWPRSLAPSDAAVALPSLIGRRLASPVPAGEPVSRSRLVGRALTDHLAAGTIAVTLPLADPHALELVRAGDHVDVVAAARDPVAAGADASTDPSPAAAASDLLVLAVLPAAGDGADPGGVTDGSAAAIVVAATGPIGLRLADQATSGTFGVVARAP